MITVTSGAQADIFSRLDRFPRTVTLSAGLPRKDFSLTIDFN
jgi:hypothetical protein